MTIDDPHDTTSINARLDLVASLPYQKRRQEIHHRLTKPRLSRFLYKFRDVNPAVEDSVQRLREIVVGSKLWLSSPSDLNDPFEFTANIVFPEGKKRRVLLLDLLKGQGYPFNERAKIVSRYMAKPDGLLEEFLADAWHKQIATIGVCSFAGDRKSTLMWSHYSSEHRGVCIQFERAKDTNNLLRALPVKYTLEYPRYRWGTEHKVADLTNSILTKHSDWSYEEEYRLIEDNCARTNINFDPSAITGLVFGCNVEEQTIGAVKEMMIERSQKGLPPVQLWQAKRHRFQYRLVIHKLSP